MARSGLFCGCALSLRLIISILTSLCVIVIAAVTLSITIVTSLSAIKSVARNDAIALLENSLLQTAEFMAYPTNAMNSLMSLTARQAGTFPSDAPDLALTYYSWLQAAAAPGNLSTALFFADNTVMSVATNILPSGEAVTVNELIMPSPYSVALATNSTQSLNVSVTAFFNSNSTEVTATELQSLISSGLVTYYTPTLLVGSAFWMGLQSLPNAPFFLGLQVINDQDSSGVSLGVVFMAPLQPRTAPQSYAFQLTAVSIRSISQFLTDTVRLPGTELFAYTGGGELIAATTEATGSVYTIVPVTGGAPAPAGCVLGLAPPSAASNATWCVSFQQISTYPYPPLQSVASGSASFAFADTTLATTLSVGGSTFIAVSARVPVAYGGSTLQLLITMEESLVIGNIMQSVNIAIGVSVLVVIVTAVGLFVLLTVLLRPLQDIANRMQLTAQLEDGDEEHMPPSGVVEIAALQDAYSAMSQELARIRSFVPQSVMAGKEDSANSSLYAAAADSPSSAIDVVSTQSDSARVDGPSTLQTRSSQRIRAAIASSRKLNVVLGLGSTSVTVLVANCVDFLPRVSVATRDEATAGIAALVGFVIECVQQRGGVVSAFHGDHFSATFNAAKICRSAPLNAVNAALALARGAEEVGLGCEMRIGIATGRCLVGNVGCAEAMSFATVGQAFTHAGILERMTRMYDGVRILATQRTMRAVDAVHETFLLDIVRLPSTASPTLIGTILGRRGRKNTVDDGASDWFYLPVEASCDARRDNIFECLVHGELSKAITLWENLYRVASTTSSSTADATGTEASASDILPTDARLAELVQHARRALQQSQRATPLALSADLGVFYHNCISHLPHDQELGN